MAVRTGEQFLEGLRDGREIWLEGERVADVTTHPKTARMAKTLAGIYDLQHTPENHDRMTFKSPTSGEPVALSYLVPETQEDLLRRRGALEIVAQSCHGMLGRTPDYVNIQLTASRQLAHLFGLNDKRHEANLRNYHEYVRERDLCVTHAFGHPQVDRSLSLAELPEPYTAVGVVDRTSEGVIVRGAKLLATLAPFSDEIFAPVYRPLRADNDEDRKYCIAFAVPVATPGLKFICRPSHDLGRPLADYPLSGQYDEMDALAIFDDVLIPWERVFIYDDVELANMTVQKVTLWRQYMQQVAVKSIAKLEFILGIVHGITEGIGIGGFSHVQEKNAEVIDTLETVRAYMRAAEADAAPYEGEGIWPAAEPWIAMRNWYPDAYERVAAIVQQLAAGGLMLTPTEEDLAGPLAGEIGKFYQGASIDAKKKVRLFRLAWDLIGTQFGSRQTLYERYFNGDVVQLRQRRYATYDYSRADASLELFMEELERG
ncbi:MAG: 4-hydroxyphenylacetate 3-monooxygenase, oxygenase component [Chloroflexi bacterium]|nr:4-hydroxyphenylacetate 3-monooxygenase, oxygenase component [Chloroflexota bacterium]